MNFNDAYCWLKTYDSPLGQGACFAKQYLSCDIVGPVEAVIIEFDQHDTPRIGVQISVNAAATGNAGGDSSHDFTDEIKEVSHDPNEEINEPFVLQRIQSGCMLQMASPNTASNFTFV